jgi:hypothetical protein
MSRAYRIAVKGSIDRIVHVDDGVCTSLELLPILPKERMAEHLAAQLTGGGFAREGNVARRTLEDGIVVQVDLDSGAVTVRVDAEVAVAVTAQLDGAVGEQSKPEAIQAARKKLQGQLDAAMDIEAARQTEQARRAATGRLEAHLRDLKQELDGAVNRATAQALKEKAGQMGEIQEIVEDEKTGALSIKVKL